MSDTQEKPTSLLDQQEALGLYLEALFLPPQVQPEIKVEVEVATETVVAVEKKIVLETEQVADQALESTLAEGSSALELADGQPEWAAKSFQILLIDIDGMEIALPMDHMNGVREFPEQITQLPNQADWVYGVVKVHGEQIQVVNTQALLMPGQADQSNEKPRYIVQLGNSQWGLACKLAERSIELPPEQVRWSGEGRKRRWVLGMIKKHLCALIDVDAFIEQLEAGGRLT